MPRRTPPLRPISVDSDSDSDSDESPPLSITSWSDEEELKVSQPERVEASRLSVHPDQFTGLLNCDHSHKPNKSDTVCCMCQRQMDQPPDSRKRPHQPELSDFERRLTDGFKRARSHISNIFRHTFFPMAFREHARPSRRPSRIRHSNTSARRHSRHLHSAIARRQRVLRHYVEHQRRTSRANARRRQREESSLERRQRRRQSREDRSRTQTKDHHHRDRARQSEAGQKKERASQESQRKEKRPREQDEQEKRSRAKHESGAAKERDGKRTSKEEVRGSCACQEHLAQQQQPQQQRHRPSRARDDATPNRPQNAQRQKSKQGVTVQEQPRPRNDQQQEEAARKRPVGRHDYRNKNGGETNKEEAPEKIPAKRGRPRRPKAPVATETENQKQRNRDRPNNRATGLQGAGFQDAGLQRFGPRGSHGDNLFIIDDDNDSHLIVTRVLVHEEMNATSSNQDMDDEPIILDPSIGEIELEPLVPGEDDTTFADNAEDESEATEEVRQNNETESAASITAEKNKDNDCEIE